MNGVERDIMRVLLKRVYEGRLLSRSAYESANHLVQSTMDFSGGSRYTVLSKEGSENDGPPKSP